MLEAIGIIAVSLVFFTITWMGLVVVAMSSFDDCKKTLFIGMGIAGFGFASLVAFLCESLNIA